MNLSDDPIALRQVARYHSREAHNQYNDARAHRRHKTFFEEIKAKLLLLCGNDDLKTPEAWR